MIIETRAGFGATLTVGEYVMPKVIDQLLNENQNTMIKMQVANTSELLKMINEGQLDFALVEGYFNKLEYDYRNLSKMNIYVLVQLISIVNSP